MSRLTLADLNEMIEGYNLSQGVSPDDQQQGATAGTIKGDVDELNSRIEDQRG